MDDVGSSANAEAGSVLQTLCKNENKRRLGTGGLVSKKQKVEDVLVDRLDAMTGFIGIIANSMQSSSAATVNNNNLSVSQATVKEELLSVKDETKRNMEETKSMIAGMNTVLMQLSKTLAENTY
ncbi:hypothetical protein FGB62_107g012 [Gracilaria domingensis]|nr:hypothetical protein FGB62_107g012 [Gracilaria domingensis]